MTDMPMKIYAKLQGGKMWSNHPEAGTEYLRASDVIEQLDKMAEHVRVYAELLGHAGDRQAARDVLKEFKLWRDKIDG